MRSVLIGAALAMLVSASAALAQPSGPTLTRIAERNAVAIGYRDASVPFSYLDNNGRPVGYMIDLCMRIVDGIRTALNRPELPVRFVAVTSQTRIPLLANGTIDMECGSTTNNLTRQRQVDFLSTVFITGAKLVTRRDSGVNGIADMNGRAIGLSQGTTSSQNVQRAMEAAGVRANVLMVRDHPRGWLDMETGRTDAYATDDVILYGLIARSRTPERFHVVGDYISFDPYAIMVPRNDSAFRTLGNGVLARLMRSGEIHQIYARWFEPGPDNINMPMGDLLRAAFQLQALPE
jgi:glutamate/aspartate transport system substrate-binding protein